MPSSFACLDFFVLPSCCVFTPDCTRFYLSAKCGELLYRAGRCAARGKTTLSLLVCVCFVRAVGTGMAKPATRSRRAKATKVERIEALTPSQVALSRRRKLVPARQVPAAQREEVCVRMQRRQLDMHKHAGRLPNSEQLARMFAEFENVEISARAARSWMAAKAATVRKARQSAKKRATREWSKREAERVLAGRPVQSYVAGVDGPDW